MTFSLLEFLYFYISADQIADLIFKRLHNNEVNVTIEGVALDLLLSRLQGVASGLETNSAGCLNAGAGV